jgi:hypothetical protein
MKRILLLGMTALALGGCGVRGSLAPPEGKPLPAAPYGAAATPTPTDLLQPGAQTRPGRSDELIQSSQERRSDKFDLPPPN